MKKYLVSDSDGTIILFDDKPELFHTRRGKPAMWFKSDNAKGSFDELSKEQALELTDNIPMYGYILEIE